MIALSLAISFGVSLVVSIITQVLLERRRHRRAAASAADLNFRPPVGYRPAVKPPAKATGWGG